MSSWSWSAAALPMRTGCDAEVAVEMVERLLGELVAAVDAVHDLERAVRADLATPAREPRASP